MLEAAIIGGALAGLNLARQVFPEEQTRAIKRSTKR